MNKYDTLYTNNGFKYSSRIWRPRIQSLVDRFGIEGRILDAPAGDGFWSRLLRQTTAARQARLQGGNIQPVACSVRSVDLSTVGCEKSGGQVWNLNEFNPEWEGRFNWVFCRGISHLHHREIDPTPFEHLSRYAKNLMVIYSTDQSNKHSKSGHHFNHTKKNLDALFTKFVGEFEWVSFMEKSYYHFVRMVPD